MKGLPQIFMKALLAVVCAVSFMPLMAQDGELVATGYSCPPLIWKKDKKVVGAGPEVAKAVLARLGVKSEFKDMGSWDDVLSAVNDGKADLVVVAYRDAALDKIFEFSTPYYKDDVAICVKKGSKFPFQKWDDLFAKKGVCNVDDSFGARFDKYMEHYLLISKVSSTKECFDAVLSGKADYIVISKSLANFESGRLGIASKVEFLDNPVTSQQLYMAIPKGSKFIKLMPQIDYCLKEYQADGVIKKIFDESIVAWQKSQEIAAPVSVPKAGAVAPKTAGKTPIPLPLIKQAPPAPPKPAPATLKNLKVPAPPLPGEPAAIKADSKTIAAPPTPPEPVLATTAKPAEIKKEEAKEVAAPPAPAVKKEGPAGIIATVAKSAAALKDEKEKSSPTPVAPAVNKEEAKAPAPAKKEEGKKEPVGNPSTIK